VFFAVEFLNNPTITRIGPPDDGGIIHPPPYSAICCLLRVVGIHDFGFGYFPNAWE